MPENQQYYVSLPDKTLEGPYSKEDLLTRYRMGTYPPDSLVWATGMNSWVNIRQWADVNNSPEQTFPPPPVMSPPPEAVKSPVLYYAYTAEGEKGPLSKVDLQAWLRNGWLTGKTPMRKEGTSDWVPLNAILSSQNFMQGVADSVAQWIGAEKISNFSAKRFFGDIFKKHEEQEIVHFFCAGSSVTTPPLHQITATWPSPWIFARVMLLSVLLYLGFYYMGTHYPNLNLVPGYMFAGNFAIPFSVLILFAELNLRRDVPWYRIFKLLLGGGFVSLLITCFINELANDPQEAYWAGPIEETAKLMATALIGRKFCLNGRILTGILCGAAVGTGFAIFESAGYTFTFFLIAFRETIFATVVHNIDISQLAYERYNPDEIMITRALLSPFCHVVWTAVTAGALWRTMGQKKFSFEMLLDGSFLRIAIIPVLLHMFWNSPLLAESPYSYYLKYGVCGLAIWLVVLILVNEGIRQVRDEQNKS